MTIKDLYVMQADAAAARENLKAQIPTIEAQISERKKDMALAAKANDYSGYKELFAQMKELETELEGCKEFVQSSADIFLSPEIVAPVAAEAVAEYNEQQKKDVAQYEKLRKQLFELFCTIVKRKKEILKTRIELAAMVSDKDAEQLRLTASVPYWMKTPALETVTYHVGEFKTEFAAKFINDQSVFALLVNNYLTEFKL